LFESSVDLTSGFILSATWFLAGDEGFDFHPESRCTKALQGLRIDPRRLMSKLLHVLNVGPGINGGMAVRAALAPQFQHT
jgi:hypothetical protein